MPRLFVRLFGPLRATWGDQDITPRGPRARTLLAVLAATPRGWARADLADLIWGPGRLRNLRQELYNLRKLPGAAEWLVLERDRVRVQARTDLQNALEALSRGEAFAPPAPLLEDLPTGDNAALEHWAAEQDAGWGQGAGTEEEEGIRRLEQLLALVAPAALPAGDAARALGAAPLAVARWSESLPLVAGALRGPRAEAVRSTLSAPVATALAQQILAVSADLPATTRAELMDLAGDPAGAMEALAEAASGGALQAWPELVRRARDAAEARAHLSGWIDAATRASDTASATAARAELDARALRTQALPLLLEAERRRTLDRLRAGEAAAAQVHAEACIALADQIGDPDDRAHARLCLGEAHRVQGDAAAAARWYASVALVEGSSARNRVISLNGAGAVAGAQGRLEDALRLHEEALALARREGVRAEIPRLLNSVGTDAERLGRHAKAATAFREAATLALVDGAGAVWATALFNAAVADLRAGRLGDARQDLRALLEAGEELPPRNRMLAQEAHAELEHACGRLDEAAVWMRRVHASAEALGDAPRVAFTELSLAGLALQRGEPGARMAWRAGLDTLLAEGEANRVAELSVEAGAWARDPATVRLALGLYPAARPLNRRHELLLEVARFRLDRDRDPATLRALLAPAGQTLEAARAWALLAARDEVGATAALEGCVLALGRGLLPAQRAALADRFAPTAYSVVTEME